MPFSDIHFLNRELSWLAFNEGVLDEAARNDLPVLERVKLLAISASNMDEFFMVRVGALQFLREQGRRAKDSSGLTPSQQWDQIHERTVAFIARQHELLKQNPVPMLAEKGIRRLTTAELTPAQRTDLEENFMEHIFPVLSPIAIGEHDFLLELGGEVLARGHAADGKPWLVGVQAPDAPAGDTMQALRLENASLATCGTYRQRFELEGKIYAHVLDPHTGKPVEHALRSVSVQHPSAALADGYATALLVLGPVRGREIASKLRLNVLWVE